jgi:hypothetical protein
LDVIRTQMYLRAAQHRALREEARRRGLALTEIVRRAIDQFLRKPGSGEASRGLAVITNLASTKTTDGSTRHDDYVADAIVADAVKKPRRKRS